MKYESPTSYGSKVVIYVGQRSQSMSQGQKFGTDKKVLSQEITM